MDLLRALALLLVVLGHWLVSAIGGGHGRLTGHSALESLTWAYPITWLFQVIPVFFMVGGYANAASLTSHRNRGGTAAGWLTTGFPSGPVNSRPYSTSWAFPSPSS